MRFSIYIVSTINQMWCRCVSKYGTCDINTVVNMKPSFTIVDIYNIYIHIYATFVNSKYIVNSTFHLVDLTPHSTTLALIIISSV